MKEKMEKIKNLLERETNNSKRYLLSKLYTTFYCFLDEKEKEEERHFLESTELYFDVPEFYDYLRCDKEIFIDFISKINKRYEGTDFNFYYLTSENKLNFQEAEEITSTILEDMPIFDKDRLYDFSSLNFQDLSYYYGFCINTFGLFKENITIDSKIDKIVTFVKTLCHEIGHNYENIYMSSMNAKQQTDRYYYTFGEVMATFFERVALDYLIRNHIYLDDAERELNCYYDDLLWRIFDLEEIYKSSDFNNLIYDDRKILYKITSSNNPKIEKIDFNYKECIEYIYGTLLGEYFFDIYRQDKREGLKRLRNFLANQGILDERQMLDSINFKENNFSFLDKGLKENLTYMRKRYKW